MILQERIMLMSRLGEYISQNEEDWQETKTTAFRNNPWFIPEFIEKAATGIATNFLTSSFLQNWAKKYSISDTKKSSTPIGLVMAGNIPLVGFHDFLCVFMSGHKAMIKPSSKDTTLISHIAAKLIEWEPAVADYIVFAEKLQGCDAYIATGSNNTGRYFEYYFGKYPHIIRKNRSSVAILDGSESRETLEALSEDIMLYFGLGCRNITKLYVPQGYNFAPLLDTLKKYDYFIDFHKYKHNFDYHLALLIMGSKYYMSNDTVVLTENSSLFSPVSQVHYEMYDDKTQAESVLKGSTDIQCIVGHGHTPFGQAQCPSLTDYADGVDTMEFLSKL